VQVRRLEPDEWQSYRALRLRALEQAPDAFSSVHADEQRLHEQDWRERIATRAIFAAADAGLVGGVERESGKVGLVSLWVAPEARSRGLGSALVEAVLSWAEDEGAEEVTLWVNESNVGAIALYERAGFAATGARKELRAGVMEIELALELPR
jgi:ribosomal protein S18 acetylase RimI-like enzyme